MVGWVGASVITMGCSEAVHQHSNPKPGRKVLCPLREAQRASQEGLGTVILDQGEEPGCGEGGSRQKRGHFRRDLVEQYSPLGTGKASVTGDRWLGVAGAVCRGQVGAVGTGTGPRLEQSRGLNQLMSASLCLAALPPQGLQCK